MQHYLLTVDIIPQRLRAHGYLVCPDSVGSYGSSVTTATEKLIDVAEGIAAKLDTRVFPTILVTKLTGGEKVVQEIVGHEIPEMKAKLRKAKKGMVYWATWVWVPSDNPEDERLMELH